MKKFTAIFILGMLAFLAYTKAAPGDKTIVRTIEFQERRIGWFDFPSTEKKYQQVLLHYKLRCPPGKQCGEWDYLSYVFLHQWYAPNFRVGKKVVESYSYMTDTSWTFSQILENGEKKIIKSPKSAVLIEFYNDSENPTRRTDSVYVWPTYFENYVFDESGKAIDSTFVEPDETLNLTKKRVFYNDDVTFSDRWEIFRYITPYGNGLNLGSGVTWTMDVTDFVTLLNGKVYLASPNGGWGDAYDQNSQEDLELTFEFIEGTPPRDVVNIQKLWSFYHLTYDKEFENRVAPVEYTFAENEKTAVMKVIQSGHGFGGTADNCAEFCRKLGMAKVDGIKRYEQYVWRNCGDIAIFPQGGTWIFDRSNWCPGAEVQPYNYELTPFITPGKTHTVDYDMEYYDLQWAGGDNTKPNWVLAGFLITYGDINHNLDARITEIISPNNDRIYNRYNPINGLPIIKVQNVGKEDLANITINYGYNDNTKVGTYILEPPLKFMEEREVTLDFLNIEVNLDSPIFNAEIVEVNGKTDDNATNNSKSVPFNSNIPESIGEFTIELRTPNSNVLGISSPIQYYLEDLDGNLFYSRATTQNDTEYKDQVKLEKGYYRFTIVNTQGFGLGFWAYQQSGLKNGSLKFTINGSPIKSFTTDWGDFLIYEFRVTDMPELALNIESDTLDFGTVKLGEKSSNVLEITPANEKGLKIENIALLLAQNKRFTIIKTEPESADGKYNLKFGDKLAVTLEFEPLTGGSKTTPFRITSNDFFNFQKTITLTGIGNDPASVNDSPIATDFEIQTSYTLSSDDILIKAMTNVTGYKAKIQVIDLYGKQIYSLDQVSINDYESSIVVPAYWLASGVYLVRIDYNNKVSTSTVMIAR